MFRLDEKTALVTGASGGIGWSVARLLHDRGAKVVLSGTRESIIEQYAQKLGQNRAFYVTTNLSDPAAADSLIDRAEKCASANIDILVNNAGLTRDTLVLRMKDTDWGDVLEVDLTAPFRLCRSALKGMLRRRSGRIINISSIVGVTGNAGQVNYAAAKAGLIGMSKSLAQEAASRGVTVNVVAPGFIETPMTDALSDAQKEKLISTIPLGTLGKPEDVAAAVLYLASEEARWVTGMTIHVNGGMAML
ncbi:MAG: 3-oxoacyl-[acyl-carrier-protein] reductase [Acetobacter sp.]|nr:3-oxoacyl-[acyl-carrier-protein] reductase [Acetobacter sp.]MBQ5547022.1 3-oxoacyl-[acyl-carrier-protein] reductase [Acetobacter sp.]